MFIVSNFLNASAQVLNIILNILWWVIVIQALLSWVSPDPYNPIVRLLRNITEPLLYPIRKMLPFTFKIGVDISPLIAIAIIIFLKKFLIVSLLEFAARLKYGAG